MKTVYRILAAWILAAVLLITAPPGVPAQGAGNAISPCACYDVSDLRLRLMEADVAIAEYTTQIDRIDPATPTTEATRKGLQDQVQAAVNNANYGGRLGLQLGTVPGGRRPAGTTWSCSMEFSETASACMLSVLKEHEIVHANKCEVLRNWLPLELMNAVGTGITWQETMTLVEYARHEIEAYRTEKVYIRDQLLKLQNNCPGIAPPAPKPGPVNLGPVRDLMGDRLMLEDAGLR